MPPFYVGLHVPFELRAERTEGTLEWLVSQVAPDVPLQVVPPAAGSATYWTKQLPTTAKLKRPTTIRASAFSSARQSYCTILDVLLLIQNHPFAGVPLLPPAALYKTLSCVERKIAAEILRRT